VPQEKQKETMVNQFEGVVFATALYVVMSG
jgi:hypothetical protein